MVRAVPLTCTQNLTVIDKLLGRKGLSLLLRVRKRRLRDVKSRGRSHTASTLHSGTRGRAGPGWRLCSARRSVGNRRIPGAASLLLTNNLKTTHTDFWHFCSDYSWAVGAPGCTWLGCGSQAWAVASGLRPGLYLGDRCRRPLSVGQARCGRLLGTASGFVLGAGAGARTPPPAQRRGCGGVRASR